MKFRYFFVMVAGAAFVAVCKNRSSDSLKDSGSSAVASDSSRIGGNTSTNGSKDAGVRTETSGSSLDAGADGQPGSGGSDAGGAGGGNGCPMACSIRALTCCQGKCVNTKNDVRNCGGCGVQCSGSFPYCDNGRCGEPKCGAGINCGPQEQCCASQCCAPGTLCCTVPGGPVGDARCVTPENGSCPAGCPNCPCASPDTPIATPSGNRPISQLRVGDLVYSVDRSSVVAVPIKRTSKTPVVGHEVLRIRLETGAVLEISAMHPTADGRTLAALTVGEKLDSVRVLSVERTRYVHAYTFDILPDSDTGWYYAAGVLIGSTLFESTISGIATTNQTALVSQPNFRRNPALSQ